MYRKQKTLSSSHSKHVTNFLMPYHRQLKNNKQAKENIKKKLKLTRISYFRLIICFEKCISTSCLLNQNNAIVLENKKKQYTLCNVKLFFCLVLLLIIWVVALVCVINNDRILYWRIYNLIILATNHKIKCKISQIGNNGNYIYLHIYSVREPDLYAWQHDY
jgi:hypothetical protein